jgi:hypothetical protein
MMETLAARAKLEIQGSLAAHSAYDRYASKGKTQELRLGLAQVGRAMNCDATSWEHQWVLQDATDPAS